MRGFYFTKLAIIGTLLFGSTFSATAQSTTFIYTGAVQSYTVGTATLLGITAVGGCGGTEYVTGCAAGTLALGGMVTCHLAVSPGEVLYIYVGGMGINDNFGGSCSSTRAGGWNGGVSSTNGFGSSSGGATDIRLTNTPAITTASGFVPGSTLGSSGYRIIVAGAGGAGADYSGVGGCGGGLIGATPTVGPDGGTVGTGGTQSAGGGGGTTGGFGWGGTPGDGYAGGGGGYWGGGGGNGVSAGGGGGSSYTDPTLCSSVVHTQCAAVANGNGMVGIQVLCTAPIAGAVVGPATICTGQSATYSDPTGSAGGYWTSSNTSAATVNSTTGAVTGVAVGSASIIYNLTPAGGFCSTATPGNTVTINQSPLPITGSSYICSANPVTLSDLSTGGTWSSSNPLIATVGSSSGTVTGLVSGFPAISYTLLGCTVTYATTVNVSPNVYNVTGGGPYCAGGTVPHVMLSNSDALVNYQLYLNGITLVSTLPGAGHFLDFGAQPASGTYTVFATNTNGGCSLAMSGSATVTMNATPSPNNVTGGTSYCAGGAGVNVGIDGSISGVNYQLYLGTGIVGAPVTGTGSAFNFPGFETLAGVYTVVGTNTATGCSAAMTGSRTVTINPLPSTETVTGGGNYCSGTGGRPVGLSNAAPGINYELFNGSSLVDILSVDAPGPLSFGYYTAVGTYTVEAVNSLTSCAGNMDGYVTIDTIPLPLRYNVTGGGGYCAGSPGVDVGLAFSAPGIHYQLMDGSVVEGPYKVGTGAPIDFGLDTAQGTLSIVATNPATGCSAVMIGTPVVTSNPLPNIYTVENGATNSYCAGGSGVNIYMGNSDAGISYGLYYDGSRVSTVVSSGGGFSFGPLMFAGSYTAAAMNTLTGCSSNMAGTATVSINPLPASYTVSGGGNYCSGGTTGVAVVLNGSSSGISYQPEVAGSPVGAAMMGTGGTLTFSAETTPGSYTIVATNPLTTCSKTMASSVSITIDPLPSPFAVTGGGTYCSGGAGFPVGLAYSNTGVSYQLYNGSALYGTALAGTGSALNFGTQSATGLYTVVATNMITGCSSTMPGGATITSVALPTVFSVTGGGSYCSGGSGVPFGLSGTTIGINYILYNGGAVVDSMEGTGLSINFGLQTTAGSYSIIAVNPVSHCTNNMVGGVPVTVNPLPTAYTVSGGGAYCADGSGVNVYLNGSSSSVSYQLKNGSLPVGASVLGTGAALNFGLQTIAGPYTIIATNNTTLCISSMTGAATVSVNSLPSPYTVTGGGSYCAGGTGVHIGLSGSNVGMNYQLNNGAPVGIPVSVSGGSIDFGLLTAVGTYSVIATNAVTGCANTMNGSVTVGINPLPAVYSMTGGGSYCADGLGVSVGLSGSGSGVGYQLYNGVTPVGIQWPGTGSALSFGTIGVPGDYTVVAQDMTTSCTNNMTSAATISVNPIVVPAATVSSAVGGAVCAGTDVSFSSMTTNGGITPSYQWNVNGTPVSGAVSPSYNYNPANGDNITLTLTSSNACARPGSVTSAPVTMLVNAVGTPNISISANTGNTVCSGTNVGYSATPVFGGLAPAYLWKVNGLPMGTDSSYFSFVPANGDNVFVTMTTTYPCPTAPVVYSNQINMAVDVPQTPVVTVVADPGTTINPGQSVTFAATVDYSGTSLTYQWMKNNVSISGATTNTYTTSNLANGDVIACSVTNENVCGIQSGTNSVDMTVTNNLAVNQVVSNGSTITLSPNPNNGEFTLKGNLATQVNEDVTIEIINVIGQVVYSNKTVAQNGKINEHIQVNSMLANGTYTLSLRSGSENDVIHFVVEQ